MIKFENRKNGKTHGVVYTSARIVNAMLDLVGYTSKNNLSKIKILEPSAGDGAFLLEIIKRLHISSKKYRFDFKTALNNIKSFEINPSSAEALKQHLINDLSFIFNNEDSIPKSLITASDFLDTDTKKFDIIIGNPPYVRHEQIPDVQKTKYRHNFATFTHRSDLYIPFFEKSLRSLTSNGKLCFICSNRWIKNQYGSTLREFIAKNYWIESIIELNSSDVFEEKVLAYPSIFFISNQKNERQQTQVVSWEGNQKNHYEKMLKKIELTDADWANSLALEDYRSKALFSIEEMGFQIGIGIATGADSIFIRKDLPDLVEKELTLPILMSRDTKSNNLEWGGNYLLNPFLTDGSLIELDKFPKARHYLLSHETILRNRHTAKKNPLKWYKTIDRIKYELTLQPKILLPDMSGNTRLLIDKGSFYPHHNLYYITGRNLKSLKILAAVLMSEFSYQQLINIGNLMNGGYPRWQSQNLRKLLLPHIDQLQSEDQQVLLKAYETNDIPRINSVIEQIVISLPASTPKSKAQLVLDI